MSDECEIFHIQHSRKKLKITSVKAGVGRKAQTFDDMIDVDNRSFRVTGTGSAGAYHEETWVFTARSVPEKLIAVATRNPLTTWSAIQSAGHDRPRPASQKAHYDSTWREALSQNGHFRIE